MDNAKVPEFSQLAEYVTESKDGYVINKIPLTQHDLSSKLTLTALKVDYQKLALIRPAVALTTKELTAIKLDYALTVGNVYPTGVIDAILLKVSAVKEVLPIIEKVIK